MVCWHTMHVEMNNWTSCFIDGQTKFALMRAKVFVILMWPPVGVLWNSARMVEMA